MALFSEAKRVERRHVVVVGQTIGGGPGRIAAAQLAWVAAGLEQDDVLPRFRQPRGHRAAAGAGSDDQILAIGRV